MESTKVVKVVRRPSAIVRRPSAVVRTPPAVVRRPSAVVRRPSAVVRSPSTVVQSALMGHHTTDSLIVLGRDSVSQMGGLYSQFHLRLNAQFLRIGACAKRCAYTHLSHPHMSLLRSSVKKAMIYWAFSCISVFSHLVPFVLRMSQYAKIVQMKLTVLSTLPDFSGWPWSAHAHDNLAKWSGQNRPEQRRRS